jgi:hypothetical protein
MGAKVGRCLFPNPEDGGVTERVTASAKKSRFPKWAEILILRIKQIDKIYFINISNLLMMLCGWVKLGANGYK